MRHAFTGDAMKGQRLPPDWSPDQNQRIWAAGRRPDLDIDEQIELFVNFWVAKTGQDATKLDWSRTFRNWIIRSYGPIKKPAPKQVNHPALAEFRKDKLTEAQRQANRERLSKMMVGLL